MGREQHWGRPAAVDNRYRDITFSLGFANSLKWPWWARWAGWARWRFKGEIPLGNSYDSISPGLSGWKTKKDSKLLLNQVQREYRTVTFMCSFLFKPRKTNRYGTSLYALYYTRFPRRIIRSSTKSQLHCRVRYFRLLLFFKFGRLFFLFLWTYVCVRV